MGPQKSGPGAPYLSRGEVEQMIVVSTSLCVSACVINSRSIRERPRHSVNLELESGTISLSWKNSPLGVRHGLDRHVGVDLAFHVPLVVRAVVVLVRLPQLPARVGQRVLHVDVIPRVFVARVLAKQGRSGQRQELRV